MKKIILIIFAILHLNSQTIKDVSNVIGIRENQLIGYGLVVGLQGTGDKSKFTMQSLQNLLRNSYIKIPTSSIRSKNIATVMVTATLPAFARQGDKIKINVSSIADAKSIDNGELLLTQLKGVDGKTYALAQGNVLANKNNKTTGFIYNGATIENEINFNLKDAKFITLSLLENDAQTASNIEESINKEFSSNIAQALDTKTIRVLKPKNINSVVKFIARIQNIRLESELKQKIVIDIKRKIIVAGSRIRIRPVTISLDDFTIKIKQLRVTKRNPTNPEVHSGIDIGEDVGLDLVQSTPLPLNNIVVNSFDYPNISDLMRTMRIMKLDINQIIKTLRMLEKLNAIDARLEIIR